MGSDESHFNVSVGTDGQSHETVSTNHNLFEEKGEPKRYRTEVLLLTSLTPALPLGQTGSGTTTTGDGLFIGTFLTGARLILATGAVGGSSGAEIERGDVRLRN